MPATINPEISIIMATYNRSHLIGETLDTIINQSFRKWECIIIDDESSDNTLEAVKPFIESDSRFKYFKRGKKYMKGLPGSRNMGIALAKGNFIQFFDDDDIIHPDNLKICFEFLKDQQYDFCRYHKEPFSEQSNLPKFSEISNIKKAVFEIENLPDMVTGKIPFASCTVLWNKRCFEELRFNESLMYGEEWECYSRILSSGYEGVSINKVLYYNRKHSNSNTGEFWNKNSIRTASYKNAAFLIIDNLGKKKLLNNTLKKFFIRLSFMLNAQEVLKHILKMTNAGEIEKAKYLLGFKIYPVLRPIFYLKGKIIKI
ncbi:glycosyltransferase family 2 protein [Zunongwangia sp. H14]|uniref:glycosyltransferase family 2 protein n=1 Tax=Zunongwangia sp. H14 TaxID=3240792 RepID=UPI00356411E2